MLLVDQIPTIMEDRKRIIAHGVSIVGKLATLRILIGKYMGSRQIGSLIQDLLKMAGENVATTENQSPNEPSPFNKEQMKVLQKLLQTTIQNALNPPFGTSTAAMAQQGNSSIIFGASTQDVKPWIVDSGALDHMTGDLNSFEEYKPCNGGKTVRIADGTCSFVVGIGLVIISKDIRLNSVLFVPKLDYNLLSISKLTRDLKRITKFSTNLCEFQDLILGRTIGSDEMSAGLYLLQVKVPRREVQKISYFVSSQNKNNALMLWHYRLGHPNFVYLRKLFPSLINKN